MYGAQGRRGSGPEWGKLRPEPDLQNFLDKQELSALDKPILFEQHESFGSYLCFNGLVQMLAGCIVCPVIMQPIQTLCGSSLASSFGLEASFTRANYDSRLGPLLARLRIFPANYCSDSPRLPPCPPQRSSP